MIKSIPAILYLLLVSTGAIAQTRIIDSLKQDLARSTGDKARLRTLLAICDERYSMSTDSLHHYAEITKSSAIKQGDEHAVSFANHRLAFCLMKQGKADSALMIVNDELAKNPVTDPAKRDLWFKLSILKAQVSNSKARAKETVTTLYGVLGEAEKYNDTLNQVDANNGIGSVRIQMDQPGEALENFFTAMKFADNPRFTRSFASLYSNVAMAYSKLGKTDSANFYVQKAIRVCREVQSLTFLANALSYQSNFYLQQGKVPEAEASLKEAIDVRTRMKDELTFQNDQVRLATFYLNTAQAEKGLQVCRMGLEYAEGAYLRLQLYQVMARCYKALNDQPAYQAMLEHIIIVKDSVEQAGATDALADMQTKYEVQKKENTIIQQELDLSRKNYFLYGSLGLLVFAAVVALLSFYFYKKREKLKLELLLQKEKDSAAMAVVKAGESERKRIAADLHDNLGAYAASIVSNLEFIRPDNQHEGTLTAMKELRHNSLSIVSQLSDTIWVLNKDALSLTAISDRVKTFIRRIQPSFPGIALQVEEHINSDFMLPPSQAYHLFQIIQEGVNNAVRHSGCRHVDVMFATDGTWEVQITDDGHGMITRPVQIMEEGMDAGPGQTMKDGMNAGPAHSGEGGNGLGNMRSRAEESGWNIGWEQVPGGGTRVSIMPLVPAADL